jgi:hypothetical protein
VTGDEMQMLVGGGNRGELVMMSTFDCHVLLVAATLSHAFATAQNVSSCSCIAVLACN